MDFKALAILASFLCIVSLSTTRLALGAQRWEEPELVGEISGRLLPEASGLAQSWVDPEILYHVNDAGSAASFVQTDRTGGGARELGLDIDGLVDAEDLATGPCPDTGPCLYIADIGDNKAKRPFITIHVIREVARMPDVVTPAFSVRLSYPDGKGHNAESFALHPSGYAYVLTKEVPAVFYRFPLVALLQQQDLVLEKVGQVDLSPWLAGTDKPKKIIPTSMDIRPDGKQLVILTRYAGVSFDIDLSEAFSAGQTSLNDALRESGSSAERLPMILLEQSEAITYLDQGQALMYSSEIAETHGSTSPLVRIRAKDETGDSSSGLCAETHLRM